MGTRRTVLQLIDLFSHRRVVSLQMIRDACGLSRRSAYRYIQSLSESDIPVYFDRESRGYRLAAPIEIRTDDFSVSEALLLVIALRLMQRHVNDIFAEQLRTLSDRLVARLPSESQLLYRMLLEDESENGHAPLIDYSEHIRNVLIHLAVQLGREAVVTLAGHAGSPSEYVFRRPQMAFDKFWSVSDASEDNQKPPSIPLDAIKHVRLQQRTASR